MKYKSIAIISLSMLICFAIGFGSIYGYCKYRDNEEPIEDNKVVAYSKEEVIETKESNHVEEQKKEPPIKEEKTDKDSIKSEVKKIEDKAQKNKVLNNNDKLNEGEKNWYYIPTKGGRIPEGPEEALEYNKKYDGYYLGDTKRKVIYLTFDEGYENGYTPKILDVLKNNGVKASFFVTTPFINENPELLKRIVNEGHIVGNHSVNHNSMAKLAKENEETFKKEFVGVEEAYKKVIGKDIHKYFRPPMGKYSEKSLKYSKDLGYKTIFWSFAYEDYEVNKQPSAEYAKNLIMERTHNGGIYLLHAISKTNTDILDWVLKEWKKQGYEFETIDKI